jgi:hypothetical protein
MAVFHRDSLSPARGSQPGAQAGRKPAKGLEIIMKEYGDLAQGGNFWATSWCHLGTAWKRRRAWFPRAGMSQRRFGAECHFSLRCATGIPRAWTRRAKGPRTGGRGAHLSIFHANDMRSALSVGPDARILRPARELRLRLVCSVDGGGPNARALASSPVPPFPDRVRRIHRIEEISQFRLSST